MEKKINKTEARLMKGNEALAEAAIRAGMDAYFGYPITPQSEILEYFETEIPKRKGVVLQADKYDLWRGRCRSQSYDYIFKSRH
jgi:2-oxoglutarate ferredoxin oxidoreductase subunit alpha